MYIDRIWDKLHDGSRSTISLAGSPVGVQRLRTGRLIEVKAPNGSASLKNHIARGSKEIGIEARYLTNEIETLSNQKIALLHKRIRTI
jgi:hypothetical protein